MMIFELYPAPRPVHSPGLGRGMMQRRGGEVGRGRGRGQKRTEDRKLTPRHLLRQLEPSLFFKGQTTSLLASETEKELVREARGGMAGRSHGGAISDSQCRARGEMQRDA
jgi:hypothetical protein